MIRNLVLIVALLISQYSIGQTLKTFSGPYNDGRMQNGNATYSYYEDLNTREYIKQGFFKYTFVGTGGYLGFNQTITGNYEKGLKNGTWNYTITMNDFGVGNPYSTGTITLVAIYRNGYADGNWKLIETRKSRNKYLAYGQWNWEPYGQLKTKSISLNFRNGFFAGAVSINDEFSNFKATGNYNENSLCEGIWKVNDFGYDKNSEYIYKDQLLYEFIARTNNGELLDGGHEIYNKEYDNFLKAMSLSKQEIEDLGITIDTICGNNPTYKLNDYYSFLLNNDYFLYEFTKGDSTFKKGFLGGCEIEVKSKNFVPLSNLDSFKKAEAFYSNKKTWKMAWPVYKSIDLTTIKPSDRKYVTQKISKLEFHFDSIANFYFTEDKFLKDYVAFLYDSLSNDFKSTVDLFKLKTITSYDNQTGRYEIVRPYDVNPQKKGTSYADEWCDCLKPWNCYNLFKGTVASECFALNPKFYEPYHIAITTSYINFIKNVNNQELSQKYGDVGGKWTSVPLSNRQDFFRNISTSRETYNKSKLMMKLAIQFDNGIKQVEKLNNEIKKKTLFIKYTIVLNDFQNKYDAYPGVDECILILTEANTFIDKISTLYSQDTKQLEKSLKDADTVIDIKAIILK
jgi:hypothetical protein